MLNDDDEWRGTTDPSVRRRVQNRLAQRTYRLRRRQMLGIPDKPSKRAANKTVSTTRTSAAQCSNQIGPDYLGSARTGADSPSCQRQAEDRGHLTDNRLKVCDNDKLSVAPYTWTDPAPWYTNPAAVVVQFQELRLGRHAGRSPSNDHLLCIMQFNVMRAFETISSIIGLSPTNLIDDDASSPFSPYTYALSHHPSAENIPQMRLPKSLAPTALQRSTPHHPWLDILPFPQMRDNLLRLESDTNTAMEKHQYDADSLCHWMVGLDANQKESGLILWGDPWNLASWEVTAEFFHKWGWTLEGCVDLFRSTNYWRVRRGERPLFATGKC